METENILYILGLLLVLFFILSGLDDVIWDLFSLINTKSDKGEKLDMEKLDSTPPKLIALMMAAWDEENVLESVIDNIIRSQMYPQTMYHIFIGVYPNDLPTVKIAEKLEREYPNVHCVINFKEGPTSKAQNLNYVIKQIKEFEKENNYLFASFTVHDSEDVVHPYELKVTNYLIEDYQALQFPVFPLIRMPKLTNFFKNITTSTYVDEFAENHYITMVNRHKTGAFVPSAGTGFSLSRKVIDQLGSEILPENSLTEDYRLSLTLYEHGIQMYYVMESIKRVNWEQKVIWDYIATRSIFPNTFKTAVKQKTRWTLGITMQSYRFRDLFKSNMPFVGKYSLYRDQKAKISNLLAGIGYPVIIYFILSLFTPLPAIYPYYSLSWYLSIVVTFMMFERQLMRGIALYNVYGFKSAFYGVLFPPLLPFRIIWGNIINFTSTFKAYLQYFKKDEKEKKEVQNTDLTIKEEKELLDEKNSLPVIIKEEKKFRWSKTEHNFLDEDVLERYHRKLGDILIEKGYLNSKQLKRMLKKKPEENMLGDYLIKEKKVTDRQLVECLSILQNKRYLNQESLNYYDLQTFKEKYKKKKLAKNLILPLYEKETFVVFAYSYKSPINIKEEIEKELDKDVRLILASQKTIKKGIKNIYNQKEIQTDQNNEINIENIFRVQQVLIIRNYAARLNMKEEEIARRMGLLIANNSEIKIVH